MMDPLCSLTLLLEKDGAVEKLCLIYTCKSSYCFCFVFSGGGRAKENDGHRFPNSSHEHSRIPQKHDLSCLHGKVGKS